MSSPIFKNAPRRWWPIAPIALWALAVGGCSARMEIIGGESIGERQMAITGGSAYTGHPAVGRLEVEGKGECTGTLVGLRAVLTAAHCIGSGRTIFKLDNDESIPAAKAVIHPQWGGDGTNHDIAVVQLTSPPSVVPAIVSMRPPAVGMPILLIGYGVTYCEEIEGTDPPRLSCTDDGGVKRRAENEVSALVGSVEFAYQGDGSTCKGDSGGPAFATIEGEEVLLGVTSRGTMPCGTRGVDTRVDAFLEWIFEATAGDLNMGKSPDVHISSPMDKETVAAGEVTITGGARDDTGLIKRAQLLVDGEVVSSTTTVPFSFTTTLAPGPHDIKVVAQDSMGNDGEAAVAVTAVSDDGKSADPVPGTFGAECEGPPDCNNGLCAMDGESGRSYCTAICEPAKADACPSISDCIPTAHGQHVCALQKTFDRPAAISPELVGGCQYGGGPQPASGLTLILLASALLLRRGRSPLRAGR